jgi:hypothetical protein
MGLGLIPFAYWATLFISTLSGPPCHFGLKPMYGCEAGIRKTYSEHCTIIEKDKPKLNSSFSLSGGTADPLLAVRVSADPRSYHVDPPRIVTLVSEPSIQSYETRDLLEGSGEPGRIWVRKVSPSSPPIANSSLR